MSSYLRKSIAMGIYAYNNQVQNFGYSGTDYTATNTAYVRLWVDLTQLAPYGPNNPAVDTTPLPQGGTPQSYVQAMDAQIRYARQLGLKVVLTLALYPAWMNGQPSSNYPYTLVLPGDLSVGGPWSTYLFFCMGRWSALNPGNGGAYADFLEICNEPNVLPQGPPPSPVLAGRMMVTAQAVARANYITSPILAGPSLLDDPGSTGAHIDVRDYAAQLVGYLSSVGFSADQYFAWSHHNYTDISNQTTTLAQAVRSKLQGIWTGWPYKDSSNPYMLITEGGARFDQLGSVGQSNRIDTGYSNCHNDDPARGLGLAMFTQYLNVTDPSFDTGLKNTALAPRVVYTTWAGEPQP